MELSKLQVRLGSVRSIRDRMFIQFWRGLKGLVLVLFTISALFPVIYVFSLSIRPSFEVGDLLPKTIIWTNYPYAWTQGNYSDLFKNSLIVTIWA
jgi:ABC-type glycerol-3-phosphate transport system permease component